MVPSYRPFNICFSLERLAKQRYLANSTSANPDNPTAAPGALFNTQPMAMFSDQTNSPASSAPEPPSTRPQNTNIRTGECSHGTQHQAPRPSRMKHQEYKTVSPGEDPEDARSSTEVEDLDESNIDDGGGWTGHRNRNGRKAPARKRVCVSILEVLEYLRETTFRFTVLLSLVLIIRKQYQTPSIQLQVGSDHKSRGPYRQSPHCPSRH